MEKLPKNFKKDDANHQHILELAHHRDGPEHDCRGCKAGGGGVLHHLRVKSYARAPQPQHRTPLRNCTRSGARQPSRGGGSGGPNQSGMAELDTVLEEGLPRASEGEAMDVGNELPGRPFPPSDEDPFNTPCLPSQTGCAWWLHIPCLLMGHTYTLGPSWRNSTHPLSHTQPSRVLCFKRQVPVASDDGCLFVEHRINCIFGGETSPKFFRVQHIPELAHHRWTGAGLPGLQSGGAVYSAT